MKRYILFDLDGTLTDPQVTITRCAQVALERVGIHVEDADSLSFFIGPPLRETLRDVYHLESHKIEMAVQAFDEYFYVDDMRGTLVYEGIIPMLEGLRAQGKVLLVATSKPTVLTLQILRHFGLEPYFDVIAGSELDGTRSRKDEVIAYAIEQAQIQNIAEAVMVGDRMHDIVGAKRHHMDSVGVCFGYGSQGELERAGVTHIVRTVSALSQLLMSM